MPTFSPGEEKTARVTMRNPTAAAFDYVGRLYLGTQKKAEVSFHLEAGEQKDVLFPVTMPAGEGTYIVKIEILVGGESIALYQAGVVEIVAAKPTFAITNLTVAPSEVYPGHPVEIVATIKNEGDAAGIRKIGTGAGVDFLVKTTPSLPLYYAHRIALASGSNAIIYPGPTKSLPEALTNIGPDGLNVFDILWHQVNGEWLRFFFYNGNPAGELTALEQGKAYVITVTEDCVWEIGDMALREISLEPGESQDVSFFVRPAEPGVYTVEANGLTKQFECVEIPQAALTIERFFLVTTPAADHGEFEVHCHVKNTGDSIATGKLNLVGEVAVATLTKDINVIKEFTLGPGEVYKYIYRDGTYKGNRGWVKVVGEWGEATPTLEFEAGYFEYGVNLVATEIGADYVYLRYTRDENCDAWDFGLETVPAEQTINFPDLKIEDGWPTIYHLVTGLLPGRTYKAWCLGRNGGSMTGRTEFTT